MTVFSLPRPRKLKPLERREALWGLLFISPWLIGFVLFTFLPTIATLIFSFTNFNLSSSAPFGFIGLKNYQDMLADPQFYGTLTARIPLGRIAEPDEVMHSVLFFVSPASDFITGQILYLDGGITATQ